MAVETATARSGAFIGGEWLPGDGETIEVFNPATNRLGLLVAAVFGLTPDLIIGKLRQQTDALKQDLSSSEAASQARIAGTSASIHRASAIASPASLQTKHEARVIRSWRTYVRIAPAASGFLAVTHVCIRPQSVR